MSESPESKNPEPSGRRGCRRFGCAGCGVLALLAILAATIGVVRLTAGDGPPLRREKITIERELPETESTLSVDLRHGTFTLLPGPAGEPLRIEADYDASIYRLEVGELGDDGNLEILFDAGAGWWATLGRTARNAVTITVPRDRPFNVVGRLGVGRSRLEFGGLYLRSIDLRTRTGQHEIVFSQPLARPMERVRVEGATSSLFFGELGNASPASTQLIHRMGPLDLDLRGAWQQPAIIEGQVSLGDVLIRRPDAAEADFEACDVQMGERRILGPAVSSGAGVVVDLDVSFGDLEIR